MNLLYFALQAAEGGAEAPSVFNLNLGVSFWTVVIFLLLLFVLAKFAFPPILGYAEAREKRIQETLDEARRTREEAERTLEEQRTELARSREEAQAIIAEGREAAERIRVDMLKEAREQQEKVVEHARLEIVREREVALEALRREAVDLSLAAASRLVERRLDAEQDRRLVQEFLEEQTRSGTGAA